MKNYRLYLVRHGITQGNLDGIYMGSGTDQPLCEEGINRLEVLKAQFRYPHVNTVFSSPMQRAIETAEILFPAAKDKIILEDLRETDFGEFEGQKMTDLLKDEAFQRWMDPSQHFTPNGGERAEDFHNRCRNVLMGMLEYMMKAGVEKAACVTHGGVIMSMLAQCGLPQRSPQDCMADPGCGYEVQCSTQMWMCDHAVEMVAIVPYGYA